MPQNPIIVKPGDFGYAIDYPSRQLTLCGDLDVAAAPTVVAALAELHQHAAGDITICLNDIRFIDAAGLGAIVSMRSAQLSGGWQLTVIGASPRTRRVFTIGQLGDLLQPLSPAARADLPPARAATSQLTAAIKVISIVAEPTR